MTAQQIQCDYLRSAKLLPAEKGALVPKRRKRRTRDIAPSCPLPSIPIDSDIFVYMKRDLDGNKLDPQACVAKWGGEKIDWPLALGSLYQEPGPKPAQNVRMKHASYLDPSSEGCVERRTSR